MKNFSFFNLYLSYKNSKFNKIFVKDFWLLLQKIFTLLKQEHKFLLSALILSFACAIIPCVYSIFTLFEDKYLGFIFLVPFMITLLINIIAIKIYKYIPKITNVLTFILNSFIIVIIQIFLGLFVISFFALINEEYMSDKPEFYEEVITNFPKERIAHFPKHIPQNARNVQLHSGTHYFFGSQEIVLKFDTDKQYIQNELEKYKFKSKEDTNHYAFSTMGGGRIKIEDFTLFVIDGNLDRWAKNYGIGVNKDFNQIDNLNYLKIRKINFNNVIFPSLLAIKKLPFSVSIYALLAVSIIFKIFLYSSLLKS